MKILIISTSLRGGSNSEILAKECERGAREKGHDVEYISLKNKEIKYCIGCLTCLDTHKCVLTDDVAELREKVRTADKIVFATPIYYFEMAGQMKTFLDRMNPIYTDEYSFRNIYMIATAAEEGDFVFEKAYNGLQGWVDCFKKAELSGLLACGGIDDPKLALGREDYMTKAYEFGASL